MVQAEVQIVMNPVEVLYGRAPPEQVRGRGGVDVLGQLGTHLHILEVGLLLVAQLLAAGLLVVFENFLCRHLEQFFQARAHFYSLYSLIWGTPSP